jgi:hypothetical protein
MKDGWTPTGTVECRCTDLQKEHGPKYRASRSRRQKKIQGFSVVEGLDSLVDGNRLSPFEARVKPRLKRGAKKEASEYYFASWKLEAGSWKLEAGSWKLEAGSWKLEAGSWKLEAGSKSDIRRCGPKGMSSY